MKFDSKYNELLSPSFFVMFLHQQEPVDNMWTEIEWGSKDSMKVFDHIFFHMF